MTTLGNTTSMRTTTKFNLNTVLAGRSARLKNRLPAVSWGLVLACMSLASRVDAAGVRQPLGVYAHINVNDAIGTCPDKKPTAQLHACLQGLYSNLLADPAISGITLGAHWDQTQPN